MRFKITWTAAFIIFSVAAWIVFDVIAVLLWGIPGTISYVILSASHSYPLIPFGVGVVCGHLFWPNINGDQVIK